jgi:hypothetical protein
MKFSQVAAIAKLPTIPADCFGIALNPLNADGSQPIFDQKILWIAKERKAKPVKAVKENLAVDRFAGISSNPPGSPERIADLQSYYASKTNQGDCANDPTKGQSDECDETDIDVMTDDILRVLFKGQHVAQRNRRQEMMD